MDSDTLVAEAIDGGSKLLKGLSSKGFPVETAFWLKNSQDESWYFYIVSKAVDEEGLAAAYRTIYEVIHSLQSTTFWVMNSDVKLIGTSHPIAQDVFNIHQQYPGENPIRYEGRQLGPVVIDEAYLYPMPV